MMTVKTKTIRHKLISISGVILSTAVLVAALVFALGSADLPLVRADPTVIYVDADADGFVTGLTWTDAYTTLEDALTAAVAGNEIWVAEGVYYPTNTTGPTARFALKAGVAIYGGFAATEELRTERDWEAHITVLSGDLDGNDTTDANFLVTDTANITGTNSYRVVHVGSAITASAVLDGFYITGGSATGTTQHSGAGMYINGGDPTLTNLTFIGNAADFNGGGMYNSGDPTLTDVTFTSNRASNTGGGMGTFLGNPTLTEVTFDSNAVENPSSGCAGGGMRIDSGGPKLTDVIFRHNRALCGGSGTAGGLSNLNSTLAMTNAAFIGNYADNSGAGMRNASSDAMLINVVFAGNHGAAYGGGFDNISGNPTLINVVFSGNESSYIGGGILAGGNPTLINVTLNGNQAYQGGGVYLYSGTTVTATNCILWGNSPTQFQGPGTAVVNYSDVQGGISGTNNINLDPLFISPVSAATAPTTTGDLRLWPNSPAVNTGDNGAVGVVTDLAGNSRIIDGVVDMGAYEVTINRVHLPLTLRNY